MEVSQKEGSTRPRRSRPAPSPDPLDSGFPAFADRYDLEIQRFIGKSAPLATLSAQLQAARRAGDPTRIADVLERLAHHLTKLGIEPGLAATALEEARAVGKRDILPMLIDAWHRAGDAERALEYFGAWVAEFEGGVSEEFVRDALAFLMRGADLAAHLGDPQQARRALTLADDLALRQPTLRAEIQRKLGAIGFWTGDLDVGASAYLLAAELGELAGSGEAPLEDARRAFELTPSRRDVAENVARRFSTRGRAAAADAVRRLSVKHGGAADRATYHGRRFQAALRAKNWGEALGAALEAGLDIELDLERTREVLAQPPSVPTDFESFLLALAQGVWLPETEPFAQWLLGLMEAHACLWGEAEAHGLRSRAIQLLALDRPTSVTPPISEPRARALRQRLAEDISPEEATRLRDEIARSELQRRNFEAAFEVLEPNLEKDCPGALQAAIDLFIVSRVGERGRVRALSRLARTLPASARTEVLAVASLTAVLSGEGPLAYRLAEEALTGDPGSERAVVAMSEVATTYPALVPARFIEATLAEAVTTAEKCLILSRAAEERGALMLSLTWAEQARNLRPADPEAHRVVLGLAQRAEDAARLADAIQTAARAFVPHDRIADAIESALIALSELDEERAIGTGEEVLSHSGHIEALRSAVTHVAEKAHAPLLLARALDLSLASRSAGDVGLRLSKLARARAEAGDLAAGLRAWFRYIAEHGGDPELPEFLAASGAVDDSQADAELYRTEVEVLIRRRKGELKAEELFRLAVLRWDLAKDTDGAFEALLSAARLVRDDGYGLMFHYLLRLAGATTAAELIEARAALEDDAERAGTLLGLASRGRLLSGERARAFQLAQKALQRNSHQPELLLLAERTLATGELDRLEALYDHVADNAYGRFGERAVRYRAARLLERRGGIERAFRHAQQAFEAAPDEGVTFILFSRMASALGKSELIPDVIDASLSRVRDARTRERLKRRRDALRANGQEPGLGQAEVLFRAMALSYTPELGQDLEKVLSALLSQEESREQALEWTKEKAPELLIALSGPDRTRAAIHLTRIALQHFPDDEFAFFCLGRAVSGSLQEAEYESLLEFKDRLGTHKQELLELWGRIKSMSDSGELLGSPLAIVLAESMAIAELSSEAAEVLVHAASDTPDDVRVSQRARELAEQSGRLDLVPAIEGLLPAPLWVRSILDRIDSLPDEEAVNALVEVDLSTAPPELRAEALEALARREERLSRFADARDTWQELLELDPKNLAALMGLERAADRDDDHEALLEILTRRAQLASEPDAERTIHLRRAAVLETHLGRPLEARQLLEELLERQGDTWSVLRLLADSFERTSEHARAAELWSRAQAVAVDVEAAADACFRAARAYFEAGDLWRAQDSLRYVDMGRVDCVELGLKVHRALGDQAAVMDALTVAARMKRDDREFVTKALLEAAEIAMKLDAPDVAEGHARDAIRLGTDSPEARLLLAQLIARRARPLEKADAEEIASLLPGTESLRGAQQREVRAYLLAIVDERLRGAEACRADLRAAIASQGPRPLLAAALARRLDDDPEEALKLYESAMGGEFAGLMSRSDVVVEAASLARDTGQFARAQAFLSAIADSELPRGKVEEMLEGIRASRSRAEEFDSKNWRAWAQAPRGVSDEARARALKEAREAENLARSQAAREERVFSPPSEPSPSEAGSREPSHHPTSDASALEIAEEAELVRAFEEGDIEAGQSLFDIYMSDRARSRDAVLVAMHLVDKAPWDPDALSCLATAASRDGSEAVALACRHLLAAFGEGEPVQPVDLALLVGQPDAASAVIFRGAMTPSAEALRIVWEHAGGLFRRDLADYEVDPAARVSPSEPGPLPEAYRGASRVLGVRSPLYARPDGEDIAISVLVTIPPSILVDGAVDAVSDEFRFHLGAMLMATAPEFVLLLGSQPEEAQLLLDAICQAFGPSERSSTQDPKVVELSARLWELIPARAQRRLNQLCADPNAMNLDLAFANATIVLRRAGLLVSGDIRTAISEVCAAHQLESPTNWEELAEVARALPEVVDLLLLAVSLEYAELRFRPVPGI